MASDDMQDLQIASEEEQYLDNVFTFPDAVY